MANITLRNPKNRVNLIWTTDWHFSDIPPGRRKDDYRNALLDKLPLVRSLTERLNGVALCGGDVFHNKPPRHAGNSLRLIIDLINALRRFPQGCVFGSIGNHDISFDRMDSLPRQPLGLLIEVGAYHDLNREPMVFTNQDESVKVWGRGIDLTDAGSPKEAILYLLAAETLSPADVQAPLALARAYAASQRTLDASDEYARALSIDPSNSDAWFGLGMMSLRQVEADTRRLISESPKSPYLASLQALVFSEEGKLPQATEQYKALLASPGAPYCSQVEYALVLARQRASADAAASRQSLCDRPFGPDQQGPPCRRIQRCLERSLDPRPAESRSIESQHGPSLERTLSSATPTSCRLTWQRHFSTSRRCAAGLADRASNGRRPKSTSSHPSRAAQSKRMGLQPLRSPALCLR